MTENPLESLASCMAVDSRDWGVDRRDAWLYAVVLGWDGEDPEEDAMAEMMAAHGWSEETVARLRRLHAHFEKLRVEFDG